MNTVKATVRGLLGEKFISASCRAGAVFYGLRRTGRGVLEARLAVRDIRRLRRFAAEYGVTVTFSERSGPAFLPRRFRARLPLLLGLVVLGAALVLLSQRLWLIEPEGSLVWSDEQVVALLAQHGVHAGMERDYEALRAAEQSILIAEPSISYISLRVRGVTLLAYMADASPPPERYDPSRQGQLVAARDGVLDTLRVYRGTALAEQGALVHRGDVLIAGMEQGADGYRQICAKGEALGHVWLVGSGSCPLKAQTRVRTGNKSVSRYLKTPLMYVIIEEGTDYPVCTSAVEEHGLLDGMFLGIYLVTVTHCEYKVETVSLTHDEAYALAFQQAQAELLEQLPLGAAPSGVSVRTSVEDGTLWVHLVAELQVDLGEMVYSD